MENTNVVLEEAMREHIENMRKRLENLSCKTPDVQEILLDKDAVSKLAIICIRSGAKNALSGRMISKLTEIINELYEWREGKGLLIQGYGNTFCSGSDLVSVRETASQEAGLQLAQIMQYNLMRLQRLPMVSLALIEGYALGGGAELATAADLRLMSSSAKIGFVHIKVGVCCGWGGGARLVELVGPSRAIDILSSGRNVDSDEAVRIGLANGLANSREEALKFLELHTVGSNNTIRAMKSMVNCARLLPICEALRLEGQLFASTWGKPAHLSALDSNIKHNNNNNRSSANNK